MSSDGYFKADPVIESILEDLTSAAVHVWTAANATFDGGKPVLSPRVIVELETIGRRLDRVARSLSHFAKELDMGEEEPF